MKLKKTIKDRMIADYMLEHITLIENLNIIYQESQKKDDKKDDKYVS